MSPVSAVPPRPPNRGRGAGFTLLELLVAAVITLLLSGLVLAVTANVLDLWRRTQGGLTATAEAKLALDLIERDLQAALFRSDGGTWLAVDLFDDLAQLGARGWFTTATRLKPGGGVSLRVWPQARADGVRHLADARFGLSGAGLRLIASTAESTGNESLSLPRVIAYQIARRPVTGALSASNPAPVRYTLFRSTAGSQATFTSGHDLGILSAAPGASAALASNVVDFGLWLYVREADGRLRCVYPEAGNSSDLTHRASGLPGADGARMPAVADVMIRVLTEEGAAQLAALEAGRTSRPAGYATDGEWWWGVVEAQSRVFIRRVEIKAEDPR